MNTSRSSEFTNKEMAETIAKRRGKTVYMLGKNKKNYTVYFVGEYKDAMKKKQNY